jgi:hypothetical protein
MNNSKLWYKIVMQIECINYILSDGLFLVRLNDINDNYARASKWLKQGDPLSPHSIQPGGLCLLEFLIKIVGMVLLVAYCLIYLKMVLVVYSTLVVP